MITKNNTIKNYKSYYNEGLPSCKSNISNSDSTTYEIYDTTNRTSKKIREIPKDMVFNFHTKKITKIDHHQKKISMLSSKFTVKKIQKIEKQEKTQPKKINYTFLNFNPNDCENPSSPLGNDLDLTRSEDQPLKYTILPNLYPSYLPKKMNTLPLENKSTTQFSDQIEGNQTKNTSLSPFVHGDASELQNSNGSQDTYDEENLRYLEFPEELDLSIFDDLFNSTGSLIDEEIFSSQNE